MSCLRCGQDNPAEARFCAACGAALQPHAALASALAQVDAATSAPVVERVAPRISVPSAALCLFLVGLASGQLLTWPDYYGFGWYGVSGALGALVLFAGAAVGAALGLYLSGSFLRHGRLPSALGLLLMAGGVVWFWWSRWWDSLTFTLLPHVLTWGGVGFLLPPLFWRTLGRTSVGQRVLLVAAAYHGFRSLSKQASRLLRMPAYLWFVGLWLVVLAVGWLVVQQGILMGIAFLLAASLPPLIAVAAADGWLGHPTTWRRGVVGVASGSVLSVQLAVVLEMALPVFVLIVVLPLREGVADLLASRELERLFYSREFIMALVTIAVVAPLVEEFVKPLGVFFLGRGIRDPREAFFLGMAGGAGFAILENMAYMGAAVWFGNVEWLGVAAVRGIGGILHPFGSGLVALGWYRWRREGNAGAFWKSYLVAVTVHALWNGFFVVMAFTLGQQLFPRGVWEFDIYGISLLGVELLFMVGLTALLWWSLRAVTNGLMGRVPGRAAEEAASPVLALAQPRQLALWATLWAALIAPVGFLAAPLVRDFVGRL